MKNLNQLFIRVLLLTAWLVTLTITHTRALPPPSDFNVSVLNLTQPTDRTIEFDVYILDTDASQPFELASLQLGFLLNSTINSGGTLTAVIDNTGSGLLATQQFSAAPSIVTTLTGYPGQTLLRLAGRTPPGAGNGTIISSTGNGTLLTHFTLTSTVAWATSTSANLVFTSSTATLPLYATRVSQYIAGVNTALAVTPGTNALVCCNPLLNVIPPSVYNVTGGGAYCEGGAGLPIGLSGSEITASYQLYKDGAIEGAPLTGTGAALSFGNKTAGTYTVMATNVNGSLLMNGSAIITANPLPLQPGAFTASTAVVYQGATGIPYTVPNDPTVTYSWTYSGTGATITGTTNSVTVSYSASATSGTLSVTATNGCGTSIAQSMAITVNELLPTDYSISVLNLTQPTDRTIEFDVYMLDTDPIQPLELATVQLGFLLNSGIYTGGTLSAAISNTGSGLIASQQFTAIPTVVSTVAGYPGQSLLRLAGRTPPGAGNGTIISSNGSGTLLTHFILTSTVPWTFNSTADLVFTSSAVVNPLYATRISAYIGTTNTALTVTPGLNALVCCNPPLNLSLPLAFDVLGSGSYCQGTGGLPVSLSGSEIGVTYTMHGGPLPEPSVNGTGSAISFGNQPVGVYTVSGTGIAGTTAMNGSAVITENPSLPATVSIAADFSTVCAGTTVNFTATPVNGGASPIISWYKNTVLDGTGLIYSLVPANGDAVYAVMDADPALLCVTGSPATSNTVPLTVNPTLPASITIAADFTTVCAGTTVNFTASPVNGGASPIISWYKNTVLDGTGLTYSLVPANGDAVYAVMDADPALLCVTGSPATSNTVPLTVNPLLPASLTIAADFSTVCAGATVNFTASPVNGGASPIISWYRNSVLDGTGLTYSIVPLNGDAVYAVMDADPTLLCVTGSPATSNTVPLTVNPTLPTSIIITASANPVNAGTTVNFTASPVNGGASPTITWYKNAVADGTGLTYSLIPVNGDAVYAVMDADPTLICVTGSPATSNTITMTVNTVLTPTTLTYSGASTVQYYANATVSATLRDNRNKGISGQTIQFTIGTQTVTAVTNIKGFATTTLQITQSAGSYQVLSSYAGNSSYAASNDTDPFTVNRKPVTASLTGTVTKVYDGNNIAYMLPSNYQLNGAITGDDVSLNNPATGTYNNKNVGTGKKVTVTGLALVGTAAANYILSNTTASANIGIITPLKSSDGIEPDVIAADQSPVFKAWPNPFTEQLNIEFNTNTDTRAQLELFDMTGNKLAILYSGNVKAGQLYNVTYMPAIGGSQMIIYRLVVGNEIRQGKLIYLDK